jgi:hypothetical protein
MGTPTHSPRLLRFLALGTLVALSGLLLAPMGAASAAGANATVTILHGLPRFTADVYVNGTLTLDGFRPLSATDALSLPAGSYDIAIRDVGAAASSEPALEATLTLKAGQNYSAIAHLDQDGKPTLTLFRNDISAIPAGRSRLVARNVAEAPDLVVRLDKTPVFQGLSDGDEASRNSAPGSHSVDVVAADGGAQLIDPTRLSLHEGSVTVVYVVGSAGQQTLDLMVQDLSGLASAPLDVQSGNGGYAADPTFPAWARLAMVLALLGVLASAVALRGGAVAHAKPPREMK